MNCPFTRRSLPGLALVVWEAGCSQARSMRTAPPHSATTKVWESTLSAPLPVSMDRSARSNWHPVAIRPSSSYTLSRDRCLNARALRAIGFELSDDAVLTPASSAAALFTRRGHHRVLVLGDEGLTLPLREAGLDVMTATADGRPEALDAVLVGWYPGFSLAALEHACQAVWAGARLYSCSQSVFFATAQGRAMGTSRAISAMIKSLTGCQVQLVGKPSLAALRAASSRLGVRTADLAVVGDDPDLEVPMAHRGRALAVAVTSGLADENSFRHLPPARWPHLHLHGVDELLAICEQAAAAPPA